MSDTCLVYCHERFNRSRKACPTQPDNAINVLNILKIRYNEEGVR